MELTMDEFIVKMKKAFSRFGLDKEPEYNALDDYVAFDFL